MSASIWKFELLGPGSVTFLEIPKGAILRHVGGIDDRFFLWMEVDEDAAKEKRKFKVVGTGWTLPPDRLFLGTVISGPFVWHVFEQQPAGAVPPAERGRA